jgi:phosphotransferase system HPr (HPr) family protein
MVKRDITIKNKTGLHARPAAILVQKANQYRSEIFLEKGDDRINAKSIMGVMMLAAAEGTTIRVIANGADEKDAVEQLCRLLESNIDGEVKS